MRVVLEIEKRGNISPWVAELTGVNKEMIFERKFIDKQADYSNSNSKGTGGVMFYFFLEEGKCYEVNKNNQWKQSGQRYFCRIENGQLLQINLVEAIKWVSGGLAFQCYKLQ